MADEAGQSLNDVKQELLTKAHEFSFIQAMRLLRLLGASPDIPNDPADHGSTVPVRIRPNLSLAFPPADIVSIEEKPGDEPGYVMTANFLGLYGPSSPLPTFYTEELIEEANADGSVSRDFLDTFNHRIFFFFYRCFLKYNLSSLVIDEDDADVIERLLCLIGIGPPGHRDELEMAFQLCRYMGLISQYSHSALALENLLRDALGGVPVEIIQCVRTIEKIPAKRRALLGQANCTLGMDCTIGSEIVDRTGKILVRIGPLTLDKFNSLLPGNPDYQRLAVITEFFAHDPLVYDVELILAQGECRPICLGGPQMSRLGLDTWVFSGETLGEVSAVFPLP